MKDIEKHHRTSAALLVDQLARCFKLGEIENLCFDLGINDENIGSDTILDRARELVTYCVRHNCVDRLVDRLTVIRSHIVWPLSEDVKSSLTDVDGLDQLVRGRVRKYTDAAKAESTKRSYESHLKDFHMFCAEHEYTALPASVAAVIDYFTFLADAGAKMSTIQVKATAISYAHRAAKLDNPIKTIEVQETLRGIRRTLGTAQKGKEPLALDELKKLMDVLPPDLRGARDKALLLMGFAGAFRRSELISLAVSDIMFERDKAIVRVRRSKTDQEGRGMTKVIPILKDKSICPVTALKSWLADAGITKGAVFRPIDRWGHLHDRIMTDKEVARTVKKYAKLAELDESQFAGHSLRAGYVTEAADRDVPLWKIKQQTGHKNDAILQRYIRDKGRGAEDATKSVFGEG